MAKDARNKDMNWNVNHQVLKIIKPTSNGWDILRQQLITNVIFTITGAVVRNQRNNDKNEKSTNGGAETKEIKGDAIDAYRLSVAQVEDTFKMDEMNRTERNGPRVKVSWVEVVL